MTRLSFTGQNIGIIASTWLVLADQSDQGIFDEDCLELARLHSDAADYPKSDRPVPLRDIPRNRLPGMKPDWNAPEVADGPALYYTSHRFIGRLYREVQLSVPRAKPPPRRPLDEILNTQAILSSLRCGRFVAKGSVELAIYTLASQYIEVDAPPSTNHHRDKEIFSAFMDYVQTLHQICVSFSMPHRRSPRPTSQRHARRGETMSQMREQATFLVNRISAQIAGAGGEDAKQSLKRAWLAYKISTSQPDAFGFRSFGLIAMHEIFVAVRTIKTVEKFFGNVD